MAKILTVVDKLLDLGSYTTLSKEVSKRSQRHIEAIQYGQRLSCPCTPSLKAFSDSPIPSIKTPCYFCICCVLLCPVTLNTPDQQQAFPFLQITVSVTHGHTQGSSHWKVVEVVLISFHGFILSIVPGHIQLKCKEVFPEACQRGYNLFLNAQSHSRRTGNVSLQQFHMNLG